MQEEFTLDIYFKYRPTPTGRCSSECRRTHQDVPRVRLLSGFLMGTLEPRPGATLMCWCGATPVRWCGFFMG
jgi:hypothetical protein